MINYSNKNNWSVYNPPMEKSGKRRYIPSEEKQIAEALVSTAGGRFKCDCCHRTFGVDGNSKFGRCGCFGDDQYYCKWCARDVANFVEIK